MRQTDKPLFSKRHFVVLARIIAEYEHNQGHDAADFWAQHLQHTNPNFDLERFIKACKQP